MSRNNRVNHPLGRKRTPGAKLEKLASPKYAKKVAEEEQAGRQNEEKTDGLDYGSGAGQFQLFKASIKYNQGNVG